MNELVQELLRWRSPHRLGAAVSRWDDWAQSIGERYGRIAQRHSALLMLFVRTPQPLHVLCQRWERVAWSLCPQINLASTIFLQAAWQKAPVLYTASTRMLTRIYREMAAARQVEEGQQVNGNRLAINLVGNRQMLVVAPSAWKAPLTRVFARINDDTTTDETMLTYRHHRAPLLLQQSVEILRRVIAERQRVEENTRAAAIVVRQQQASSSTSGQGPFATESSRQSDRQQGTPFGTSSIAYTTTPSMPAISIANLTEQVVREIDRRLVAYRERIGRPL